MFVILRYQFGAVMLDLFLCQLLGDRLCAFRAMPWSQLFYVDGFCPPFTGGRFHSDVVVAVATFSVATVQ